MTLIHFYIMASFGTVFMSPLQVQSKTWIFKCVQLRTADPYDIVEEHTAFRQQVAALHCSRRPIVT